MQQKKHHGIAHTEVHSCLANEQGDQLVLVY